MAPSWYCWEQDSLIIQIRLQPGASCDEIIGPHGNQLKIRIIAPPIEGKANAHLIRFLAKSFQISKNKVHLLSGTASRDKRVRIEKPAKLLPDMDSSLSRSDAR